MKMIDNFALNLSDFNNGWGGGLLTWVGSVWSQFKYMDQRLHEEGYSDKGLVAAESWLLGWKTHHTVQKQAETQLINLTNF